MSKTSKPLATLLVAVLSSGALTAVTPAANAEQTIGFPTFSGPALPAEPVGYTPGNMMRAIYDREAPGTDFWMDRLLARQGADPAGNWLMTRGRTVYLRTHSNSVIGFGGRIAYYDEFFDSFANQNGYAITIGTGGFAEQPAQRLQTPSYWSGVYLNTTLNVRADVKKFITQNNVAVTNLSLTNTGTAAQTLALSVDSPFTRTADGAELTGVHDVLNSRNERLTTVFPHLSGDGLTPSDGKLTGSITVQSGQTVTLKVQLGFLAEEIPESKAEYDFYRTLAPATAFATHVRTYNKWWADNVPYIDVPEPAIKKYIYYRWWLMRFNYLDADIPGNDYQFPTSIEGVLGYNNAIALTVPMFIDDLKYLRDPMYSYGPWVSMGETSRRGRFMDNPGDPENWSNSYTQYTAEAAWRSYQIHGGQAPIVRNLARYAEDDVKGQLSFYDHDHNNLIEYDAGFLTGNDADAVSFDFKPGNNLDRTESAYQYSGAMAAAQAYQQLGNTAKANEMRGIADNIKQAILNVLWNPDDQLFEHRVVATNEHDPWKEINNYYPFSVGAIPNQQPYTNALRLFADPAQYPIFPFYTANQADKAAAAARGFPGSNNFSQINSTVQFRLFSSVLRNYSTNAITAEDYKKLLYWNAWAGFIGGNTAFPDTNEFWFNWNPATQNIDGRSGIHHTILGSNIWTVIEDVAGLRPRNDNQLELSPINIGWDHFTVNNLRYRNADLSIVWDDPANPTAHYPGVPKGFSAFVNGERVFTVDKLTHLVFDPDRGTVSFPGSDTKPVRANRARDMRAPGQVRLTSPRIVDLFAKAGADLTDDARDLALGATATASFTEPGSSVAGATDGSTINEPNWSTRGSPNATDTFDVDLSKYGRFVSIDTVKLYFYRDRTTDGLAEPATYRLQVQDRGRWVDVPDQVHTPAIPRANLNEVQFRDDVRAQRIRVLLTHQAGHRTGLKEIQVFRTGDRVPPARNVAPYVLAKQDPTFHRPAKAKLVGVVKDDSLPSNTLTTSWSQVDGPGTAIFADPAAANTVATFTKPGDYTLRLTATDGAATSSSVVTVTATPIPDVINVSTDATASASYTSPWESVGAINDGIDPPVSNDGVNRRWGTWPNEGEQWVQLDWTNPVRVNASDLYFFDDGGGVRVPASWRIQYWDGSAFVDMTNPSAYGTAINQYNNTTFGSVTTTRMRAVLQSGVASVGVLEWKLYAEPVSSIDPVQVNTSVGHVPALPATATKVYADGARLNAPVAWEPITPAQVATPGTFTRIGIVDGTNLQATATITVSP